MRGCGALRIQAPALEEFVAQTVLFRIQNNKKLIRDLGKPNNTNIDREYKQTNEQLSEIEHKKELLLDMLMSGEIKKPEYDKQRAKLNTSEKGLTQNLLSIEASRPMLKVVNASNIEKAWEERTVAEKRNLLGLLIESVEVFPALVKGRKSFDPDRVKITFI
jgi:septal ring factor EnvC (AmiA/AmiB activator)